MNEKIFAEIRYGGTDLTSKLDALTKAKEKVTELESHDNVDYLIMHECLTDGGVYFIIRGK